MMNNPVDAGGDESGGGLQFPVEAGAPPTNNSEFSRNQRPSSKYRLTKHESIS